MLEISLTAIPYTYEFEKEEEVFLKKEVIVKKEDVQSPTLKYIPCLRNMITLNNTN